MATVPSDQVSASGPRISPPVVITLSSFSEDLSVSQAFRLAREIGISSEQFERISGASPNRLRRGRAGSELVSPLALEPFRRCTAVYLRAVALCGGDAEAAKRWLNGDAPALKGKKPIEAAETRPGLKAVENLLSVLEKAVGS